jgi:hypothetical protein
MSSEKDLQSADPFPFGNNFPRAKDNYIKNSLRDTEKLSINNRRI